MVLFQCNENHYLNVFLKTTIMLDISKYEPWGGYIHELYIQDMKILLWFSDNFVDNVTFSFSW